MVLLYVIYMLDNWLVLRYVLIGLKNMYKIWIIWWNYRNRNKKIIRIIMDLLLICFIMQIWIDKMLLLMVNVLENQYQVYYYIDIFIGIDLNRNFPT